MAINRYRLISAVLFTLVALAHLCRLLFGWQVVVDNYEVPMWFSWIGLLIPGGLAVWALSGNE